jgi:hypothetical protein
MPDFTSGDPADSSDDATSFVAPGADDDQQETVTADNPVVLELGGRKFTKNDLLKKVTNADAHIAKLEAERKSDFEKFAAMEAKLKELGDLKALIQTLKPGTPGTETKVTDPKEGVDVEAAIKAALDARTANEQAAKTEAEKAANWKEVTEALTKRYGKAETNARVAKAAEEAGLSVKEAAELAKSKPKAFLKLFNDLDAPKPTPAPARRGGTVNSAALSAAPAVGPSGYAGAKSVKERVAIMQAAYAKHGL